ncbi:MAG: DUF1569 domain-containing protein [Aquirufa sp.]
MKSLEKQLAEIDALMEKSSAKNPLVSEADVAWHLEHSLLVINQVISSLKHSNAKFYQPTFSIVKWLVIVWGIIPKGKAKAPQAVSPKEGSGKDKIIQELALALENVEDLKSIPGNKYFEHPLFGHINTKLTPRFLAIHTHHHLKIVKAINGRT